MLAVIRSSFRRPSFAITATLSHSQQPPRRHYANRTNPRANVGNRIDHVEELIDVLQIAAKDKEKEKEKETQERAAKVPTTNDEYGTHTYHKLFRENQAITPRDFTYREQTKFTQPQKPFLLGPGRRQSRKQDPFLQQGIDPVREALNRPLLQAFTSNLGMILPRSQTGLSWWGQRRVGKAIRRARAMYIMPKFSKPPARRAKRIDSPIRYPDDQFLDLPGTGDT